MFTQEQESVCGSSVNCHVDAEGLLKVTISCTVEVVIFLENGGRQTRCCYRPLIEIHGLSNSGISHDLE